MAATLSDPGLTAGILVERDDGEIVLTVPHTDYRLHLAVAPDDADALAAARVNHQVVGRITANARRVDVVTTGGRYIDPVYGRPRILQGSVTAVDESADTITVNCGCPFVVTLMPPQRAEQFRAGMLVTFSVERGARFEPAEVDVAAGAAGPAGVEASAAGVESPIHPANPSPAGAAVEKTTPAEHAAPVAGPIEPPRGVTGQEKPYGDTPISGGP